MLKTKKYLILKKSDNRYEYIAANGQGLGTLHTFLNECCRLGVNSLRKYIGNPTIYGVGNDISWERKGKKIIITLQYGDDSYKYAFETTLEELNCILDQWEEILKTMPEDVVLVLDSTLANGSPTFLENNKSTPHE